MKHKYYNIKTLTIYKIIFQKSSFIKIGKEYLHEDQIYYSYIDNKAIIEQQKSLQTKNKKLNSKNLHKFDFIRNFSYLILQYHTQTLIIQFQICLLNNMSEQDLKFNIDMNKIKGSKLYQKFVKNMDNQKTKEEKSLPKPIQYQINYNNQQRPQSNKKNQRDTLVKSSNPVQTQQQKSFRNQKKYEQQKPQKNFKQEKQIENIYQISNRRNEMQLNPNRQQIQNSKINQINFANSVRTQKIQYNDSKTQNIKPKNQNRRIRNFMPFENNPAPLNRQIEKNQNIKQKKNIQTIIEQRSLQQNININIGNPGLGLVVTNKQSDPIKQSLQYKNKLQKLTQSFEEFKNATLMENKHKKVQILTYQQTIQNLKQKLYQFQTKEDQLTLQNQKLKQKLSSQAVIKTRLQQQNKQLNYRIQQMNDMLDSKQSSLKKKIDEATYWKNQTENTKTQFHNLKLANQRLSEALRQYQQQFQFLKRQKQNQQALQNDLKEKVTYLIRENARLKDQMHYTSSRLNQLQNQNFLLKTDLKRDNQNFQQNQSFHMPQYTRPQIKNDYNYPNPIQKQTKQPRRRGQFNKQRQKMNENRQNSKVITNGQQSKKNTVAKQIEDMMIQKRKIEEQLQKMRDLKVMNGAMRKRKIEMQREIQRIHLKLNELYAEGKN